MIVIVLFFHPSTACRKFDTKNCTTHYGTMLFNGTCMVRDCHFLNGSDVTEYHLNPVNINSSININCNIDDETWKKFKAQNTKMPSDEYFQ